MSKSEFREVWFFSVSLGALLSGGASVSVRVLVSVGALVSVEALVSVGAAAREIS